MPPRSLEAKLQELLAELTVAAAGAASEIRRRAPSLPGKLDELATELSTLAKHPRSLGARIEAQSAWLNRKFLNAASNVAEPFLLGMGLRVELLTEESVDVVLPGSWRNQTQGGLLHPGALVTAGEFAGRIYWEHHLDLSRSELSASDIRFKLIGRPKGDVRAVFRMPVSERETVFHRLRADGQATVEAPTLIYDSEGKLLAEVDVTWSLQRHLALGPGESQGT